jgi:hypothetical protein
MNPRRRPKKPVTKRRRRADRNINASGETGCTVPRFFFLERAWPLPRRRIVPEPCRKRQHPRLTSASPATSMAMRHGRQGCFRHVAYRNRHHPRGVLPAKVRLRTIRYDACYISPRQGHQNRGNTARLESPAQPAR